MSKYLLVGDIHLADRPPSSCTESYTDDLFDLLRQTVDLATELEVDAVVWAGDVFHVKAASRNSHRLVQRTIELGTRYPCPWIIVPGNHDIEHDRLQSLNKQPLGTLFQAGAIRGEGQMSADLYCVPWQQDWTSYYPPVQEDNVLVVAHAPLYPPGIFIPHDEFYDCGKWATAQKGGACFYGHVHEAHGAYKVVRVWFCNNGAITRGSLHESELTRDVCVTLYDGTLYGDGHDPFTRIVLDYKPASEVFRLVEAGEAKDAALRLDEFIASVGATQVQRVTDVSVIDLAREKLGPEAAKLVQELLEVSRSAA